LGLVLARPAVMPLPAFAMRAAFGELADGALLASQRAVPAVLERVGYQFRHPNLEAALRFTLGRPAAS
jgi:NAD dependent epimerase/dehydratase family enzyme